MASLRAQNKQGVTHKDGPVEEGGLLEYFFGKDGKDCFQIERFSQFLRDLQDEVSLKFLFVLISIKDQLYSFYENFQLSVRIMISYTLTYFMGCMITNKVYKTIV